MSYEYPVHCKLGIRIVLTLKNLPGADIRVVQDSSLIRIQVKPGLTANPGFPVRRTPLEGRLLTSNRPYWHYFVCKLLKWLALF